MKKCFSILFVAVLLQPAAAQTVSTLAPSIGVNGDGIAVTADGEVFVPGGIGTSVVMQISPDGTVTSFVEDLPTPVGIAIDSDGHLIVNNYEVNTVSRISPNGTVETLATELNGPAGIIVGPHGDILFSEFGANYSGDGSTVRRIGSDGTVETYIEGDGLQDVVGLAMDEEENIYVSNWSSGEIYKSDGTTTELFADIDATVNQIAYVDGYLYVPSPSLRKVFRIDRDGNIEHIAGSGENGTDDGPALEASFTRPNSITAGPDGKLYIVDADQQAVRVLEGVTASSTRPNTVPGDFELYQNHPNPSRSTTSIAFTLERPHHVRLTIYDLVGREREVVVDELRGAGTHEETLDISGYAAGTYAYRLHAGDKTKTRLFTAAR